MECSAQELLNIIIFLMIPHELPGLSCHPPARASPRHEVSPRAALPNISHQQSHSQLKSGILAGDGAGLFFTSYFFQHLACPLAWQGSAFPVAQSCEPSQSGSVSLNATVRFNLYLRYFVSVLLLFSALQRVRHLARVGERQGAARGRDEAALGQTWAEFLCLLC